MAAQAHALASRDVVVPRITRVAGLTVRRLGPQQGPRPRAERFTVLARLFALIPANPRKRK